MMKRSPSPPPHLSGALDTLSLLPPVPSIPPLLSESDLAVLKRLADEGYGGHTIAQMLATAEGRSERHSTPLHSTTTFFSSAFTPPPTPSSEILHIQTREKLDQWLVDPLSTTSVALYGDGMRSNFNTKGSISYNAAMYYLIKILESNKDRYNSPADQKLRNGLVHGYFAIEPGDVKIFVQGDTFQKMRRGEGLENNELHGFGLYKKVSNYGFAEGTTSSRELRRTDIWFNAMPLRQPFLPSTAITDRLNTLYIDGVPFAKLRNTVNFFCYSPFFNEKSFEEGGSRWKHRLRLKRWPSY